MKKPFTINIQQPVIDDLQKRLAATRWTSETENEKWQQGTNKSYLKKLCAYWQNNFDWKKQEAYLNSFHHYKTTIDDVGLHFIYEKGEGKNNFPLLLMHGFPDSFIRFHKLIPLLTKADENDFSFDVIVPSIPGYGFSDIPKEEGMNPKKIAGLFTAFMTKELGYEKFAAHGGDWGSSISEQLAFHHSKHVSCIHLTEIPYHHIFTIAEKDLSKNEKKYLETGKKWQMTEGGYAIMQSTKPQTLGYGLNDSPAGLAAWIIEKFYRWSDNDGNLENAFTKDELLTNLSIYWFTQTINSAVRLYYETMKVMMNEQYNPLVKHNPFNKTKTEVPTAFAIFPKDLIPAPKEFAERFFNVQQWNKMKKGGHFAALEEPEALAGDIRKFVMKFGRK